MSREDAIAEARAQYQAGEIDADDYEVALLGIEYAAEQSASAQDEQMEVTA